MLAALRDRAVALLCVVAVPLFPARLSLTRRRSVCVSLRAVFVVAVCSNRRTDQLASQMKAAIAALLLLAAIVGCAGQ